jgi:Uma2 family endonuclease
VKLTAYARGGVPVYWIVNLVEGIVETYCQPDPSGHYLERIDHGPGATVAIWLDGRAAGQVAASDILN